jgi:acid phosphatase (class A)
MFTRRTLLALALVVGSNAFAAPGPYLTHKQLDVTPFLPAPVANGSAEDRAQQLLVIAAQKAASPERIALANSDADETVYAMFSTVLDANFKPANLPLFSAMFERMGETEDAVVDPVKAYFGRTRPFLNNPEIKPLVKPSKSGSYPSGHTSRSTMMAIVLSSMLPEKRAAIFARANEYADSRIIGGMHYPNDLEGGRRAGTAMAATLLASPTFQTDFDAARVELRKALGLQ